MPKPAEYTLARRYIMQAVMWVMLGVSIILAAAVSVSARRAHLLTLSTTVTAGDISVHLPANWHARPRPDDDPRVIAQAAELTGQGGRSVFVLHDRIDSPMSPLQYLARNFSIDTTSDATDENAAAESPIAPVGMVDVAGTPGILMTLDRPVAQFGQVQAFRKDLYACAVLPTLDVITVHLMGEVTADVVDQAMVRQIASAIEVHHPARLEPPTSVVTLPEGIELTPPAGLLTVPKDDPNRTDRLLWQAPGQPPRSAQHLEQTWTAVEVVGCLFPHLDANDPKRLDRATSALTTILLCRDSLQWRGAKVTEESGIWRADPTPAGQEQYPTRAYLISDPSGRAMLAILHGGWEGGGAFDTIAKQLAAATRFLPSADTSELEDTGAAEAARSRRDVLPKLLKELDEQWWLLTDQTDHPYVGWTHLVWDPKKPQATVETRRRSHDGSVTCLTERWLYNPDTQQYNVDTRRTLKRGTRVLDDVQQAVSLRNNQLTLTVGTIREQRKIAVPSQFLPGGPLPLLVGSLAPGPLLLKTDTFPGIEAVAAPEPLTLIIRPDPQSTRRADGQDQPLRCVTAQVNGTGRVTRWYFRSAGDLEFVEFPGTIRRVESDLNAIRVSFRNDDRMLPAGE